MFQLKVLVGKLLSVNGLASGTVATGEVSALKHEVRNDSVEVRVLEPKLLAARALFAGAESSKYFNSISAIWI